MDNTEIISKMGKGILIVLIGLFSWKILNLLTKIIIARFLGAGDFGLLNLGLTIFTIFSIISILGLNLGGKRYLAQFYKDREKRNYIIKITFIFVFFTSLILSFVLFSVSDFISLFLLKNLSLSPVLKIFSVGLPFFSLSELFLFQLEGFMIVKYRALIERIFKNIFIFLFVWLILFFGFGLNQVIWIFVFSFILVFILSFYQILKRYDFKLQAKKFRGFFSRMLTYSWPVMFNTVMYNVIIYLDTFMISYFLSEIAVGLYSSASEIARLLPFLLTASTPMFFSLSSRLNTSGMIKKSKGLYINLTRLMYLATLPFFVISMIFSEEILFYFFGSQFVGQYLVLNILLIGFFITTLAGPVDYYLNSFDKTKWVLFNYILGALFNFFLNIILITRIGIIGAAISTTFSIAIHNFLGLAELYSFKKIFPYSPKFILPTIIGLAGSILLLLSKFLFNLNLFLIIFFSIGFLLLYFTLVIKFSDWSVSEKEILIKIKYQIIKLIKNKF